MLVQWVRIAMLASLVSLLPAAASAQIPGQPPEPPDSQLIDPPTDGPVRQDRPRSRRSAPAPVPQRSEPAPAPIMAPSPRASAAAAPAGAPRTVACSGVFAKESTHLKLAVAFNSKNVTFTEVDGDGGKMMASVVYPSDPKRRLEVLWQNEGSRSDTSVIVISGQSGWSGPKGLKLGLPLVALEKLNGKPFKLKGGDKSAAVADWQGGALDKLPGGCKVGVHLSADADLSGKDLISNDAGLRATKAKVSEILIGY